MVKTTCPYCGVGCGISAKTGANGAITIIGDETHPANFGKLCAKGSALGQTLGLEGRLLSPRIAGHKTDWNTALKATADGLNMIRDQYGPDAIGFYVSGQLLTEDYYIANKLMKGFIGSANIDTNSRLCMSSSVSGHKRAFGSDTVPGCYDDWEQADLVLLTGSNAAWCHPILFQRLMAAKEKRGTKIVVIDPRRTATSDAADLHLALKPGSDVKLFNGLLAHLAGTGAMDAEYVAGHTSGMRSALMSARADAPHLTALALECGLEATDIRRFFDLFTRNEKVMTAYSQGVNQSSQGTDKVNAIINCHLLTGRIGKPGMGPFSLTGQPNAMGGREVGGMANTLAAHMEFDAASLDRVGRFWQSDSLATKPGLKATDMFRAAHEGRIKAIWIMGTNPAVSMPDADFVRAALAKCELVIVSDVMAETDSLTHAHIVLPALAWGEKDGTVTNSERRISRQRAFLSPPGDARPDWWIISNVARHMGFTAAFEYQGPYEIFREHAALSAFENNGARDFDLSGLETLSVDGYDSLAPAQWPVNGANPAGTKRLFADAGFYTPDGRAQFVAVRGQAPANAPSEHYPLILNSGRNRDQWHTMTRSGKSPKLTAHQSEPALDVNPTDADRHNLVQGGFVRINSRWGDALLRVRINEAQQPGQVFMALHWSDVNAARAVLGRLVNPAVDPHSGQPELKHTPVRIESWTPAWHGFLLSRQKITPHDLDYWCASYQKDCHILTIAGAGDMAENPFLGAYLSKPEPDDLSFDNPASGQRRLARTDEDGRLALCLFVAEKGALPAQDWLQAQFRTDSLGPNIYKTLLSGRPHDLSAISGPIICSCFGVSQRSILGALSKQPEMTLEGIGEALGAGSNCGACRPEIKDLMVSRQICQ